MNCSTLKKILLTGFVGKVFNDDLTFPKTKVDWDQGEETFFPAFSDIN